MVVTGALVFLQQRVLSGRSYTTVAGKAFRPRSLDLGRWRWFTFGLGIAYLLIVVVLPLAALIVAAFRKFMFIRDAASLFDMRQYSLMHFNSIFENPLTFGSIYNAVEVGITTAVADGVLAFAIRYTLHPPELDRRDDGGVSAGDPRARLLAVPLHQQHHGDVGVALGLLRGRQHRQDRGVQPGADGAARRADRAGQLAIEGRIARERRPYRIRKRR